MATRTIGRLRKQPGRWEVFWGKEELVDETDPLKIESTLYGWSKGREKFIPSRTLRSKIRHGRLDQLERFTVNGVQAISVEGQDTDRLGRIAWMVWTGLLTVHLEEDHKADWMNMPGSNDDIHEQLHGRGVPLPPPPD
jgi:hypothetical protein